MNSIFKNFSDFYITEYGGKDADLQIAIK